MSDKNSTPKLPENPFKKKPSGEIKKALAPCPRCKSNETTVQIERDDGAKWHFRLSQLRI